MKGYIYKITNMLNNKVYIGQTLQNYKTRWSQHRNFKHGGRILGPMYKDFESYGLDNFKFEVLEEINKESRQKLSQELDRLEIQYIKDLNSLFPNGYNRTKGGTNAHQVYIGQTYYNLETYHPGLANLTLTYKGVTKYLYEWIADSSEDWLTYLTTLARKIVYEGWECSDPSAVPVFCGDPPFSNVQEWLEYEKLEKEKETLLKNIEFLQKELDRLKKGMSNSAPVD